MPCRAAKSFAAEMEPICWLIHLSRKHILEFDAMSPLNVLPEYEVFAIRYARMPRIRREHFIRGDPTDGPMPMDFFVWLLRAPGRLILIHTGFIEHTAKNRNCAMLRSKGGREWRGRGCLEWYG